MTLFYFSETRLLLSNSELYADFELFFKPRLLENDSGLLVAILEALATTGTNKSLDVSMGSEDSERNVGVDPARLAQAHVQLRNLKDHEYNTFEAAFFSADETDSKLRFFNMVQIFLPIGSLLFFFIILLLETLHAWQATNHFLVDSKDGGTWDNLILIYVVNGIACIYFFNIIGFGRQGYKTFNKAMDVLCLDKEKNRGIFIKDRRRRGVSGFFRLACQCVSVNMYRRIARIVNRFSNETIGLMLYILNFFFIQTATTPLDAVLNSVATAFILDIDSSFRPFYRIDKTRGTSKGKLLIMKALGWKGLRWIDWELKSIEGKLMAMVDDFIKTPMEKGEVKVKKKKGKDVKFLESDVCFFRLYEDTMTIQVDLHRRKGNKMDRVEYKVMGTRKLEFWDALAEFDCTEVM
jgi:hypothetical protein